MNINNSFSKILVTALYKKLLNREPDFLGISSKVLRLEQKTINIEDVISEILNSEEFKFKIYEFISNYQIPMRFTNNQTQFNELDILFKYLLNKNIKNKIVVDVGARGKERSNSWDLLHHFGWKGILIEANFELQEQIKNDFFGLDYELILCACSNYSGFAQFTLGVNDDVSSLNSNTAKEWGETRGEITVEVFKLQDLLEQRGVPNNFCLLSLDIEGEDIIVLNDLIVNSSFRPEYIIIEASYDFKIKELTDLNLVDDIVHQYQIIGQTAANLICEFIPSNKTIGNKVTSGFID